VLKEVVVCIHALTSLRKSGATPMAFSRKVDR
jgi:hypothetical protein